MSNESLKDSSLGLNETSHIQRRASVQELSIDHWNNLVMYHQRLLDQVLRLQVGNHRQRYREARREEYFRRKVR